MIVVPFDSRGTHAVSLTSENLIVKLLRVRSVGKFVPVRVTFSDPSTLSSENSDVIEVKLQGMVMSTND